MKLSIRHLVTAARLSLGFIMFVFGLNFFLHFLPVPPLSGAAGAFLGALVSSGYVLPIVKSVEVVAGLLLLTNTFVPLALTVLAPVVVGIVGFHASLAPDGGLPALLVLVLELALAYAYRAAFAPLFHAKSAAALGAENERDDHRRSAAQPYATRRATHE